MATRSMSSFHITLRECLINFHRAAAAAAAKKKKKKSDSLSVEDPFGLELTEQFHQFFTDRFRFRAVHGFIESSTSSAEVQEMAVIQLN